MKVKFENVPNMKLAGFKTRASFDNASKVLPEFWKNCCNYSEPSPKIMSALPEKAAVNASNALMPCLLPVLMNDINLT